MFHHALSLRSASGGVLTSEARSARIEYTSRRAHKAPLFAQINPLPITRTSFLRTRIVPVCFRKPKQLSRLFDLDLNSPREWAIRARIDPHRFSSTCGRIRIVPRGFSNRRAVQAQAAFRAAIEPDLNPARGSNGLDSPSASTSSWARHYYPQPPGKGICPWCSSKDISPSSVIALRKGRFTSASEAIAQHPGRKQSRSQHRPSPTSRTLLYVIALCKGRFSPASEAIAQHPERKQSRSASQGAAEWCTSPPVIHSHPHPEAA